MNKKPGLLQSELAPVVLHGHNITLTEWIERGSRTEKETKNSEVTSSRDNDQIQSTRNVRSNAVYSSVMMTQCGKCFRHDKKKQTRHTHINCGGSRNMPHFWFSSLETVEK